MANEEILIVEDNKLIVEILKNALSSFEYQLSWARSGEAALKRIQQKMPDLLLWDMFMGGVDSLTACRYLRQHSRTALLPIIILTGRVEELDKILGMELGRNDGQPQLFEGRELVARIKTVLRRGIASC